MASNNRTKYFQIFSLLAFSLLSFHPSSSSASQRSLIRAGSSISVEKHNDVLVSPDQSFTAGFYNVGENAYCFSIWFTNSNDNTVTWMANRDQPVNGKSSTLSLQKDGDLVLKDANRFTIWATNTNSTVPATLALLNTGNLVLRTSNNYILWQSFDFPTDSLLPQQPLTRNTKLVSARSRDNYSPGFYSLYFDNDNILRIQYNGPQVSSVYWPDPGLVSWDAGRTTYNSSRIASFDDSGMFQSTDDLKFFSSDFGIGPKRRLVMDFDGNLRLYSLNETEKTWVVSWQAIPQPCMIHGVCGPNGICIYGPERRCTCPPGYKVKELTDWTQGCQPTFNLSCDPKKSEFAKLHHVEYYGYDINYTEGLTLETCRNICLQECSCKAFMYLLDGIGRCFPKTTLLNGYQASSFSGTMHIKVPKNDVAVRDVGTIKGIGLNCSAKVPTVELPRQFESKQRNNSLKYVLWFVYVLGGAEVISLVLGFWYLNRKQGNSDPIVQGYIAAATGFRKYTYRELKKATKNFSEEIGRGGAGSIYKGVLPDQRIAAVKRLEGLNQGEAEFLAEVSTIGRIYHMNLIQMWGFCAEGKHRLLVYEFMEHGSLAENLSSQYGDALDWEKRFEIALGTAKGLAYLHEELLEWVLHCDVKPQNILLDKNFKPKVADFGLSKLLNRGGVHNSSFSRVRGTRGYMAPEWILNLPITSKVDVYSYGIVVLEMVTGKSSTGFQLVDKERESVHSRLVPWVREKMATSTMPSFIDEIIDPRIDSEYDPHKMEILVKVALQCVEEEKDIRPTMSQVVEILIDNGNDPQQPH